MPQLDLATYFSQTLFVLAVFWVLVYVMIFYFLKHGVVTNKLRFKIKTLRGQGARAGHYLWTTGAAQRLHAPAGAVTTALAAGQAVTVTLDTEWSTLVLASHSFE